MKEDHESLKDISGGHQPKFSMLAEPDPNHGAMKMAEAMHERFDQSLDYALKEINDMIDILVEYKTELTAHNDVIKLAVRDHFTFTAEVMSFKKQMKLRLKEIVDGRTNAEPASASPDGGPEVRGSP